MKTTHVHWMLAAALLSAPVAAFARNPRDSRHPDPRGRRHCSRSARSAYGWHQPPPVFHVPPPAPTVVYYAPPPPVYYYPPPPPPPPPVVCYPPPPGFSVVLNF